MTEKREAMTTRRPYHKPQLEQVQLVAEEAVLKACKGSFSSGTGEVGCQPGTKDCKNKLGS